MANGETISPGALGRGLGDAPALGNGAASAVPAVDPSEIYLFGVHMTSLDFEGVCVRIAERVRAKQPGFIVTPNVNHVCTCERDPAFHAAYVRAFLALPDGMPIILASRLLGTPLKQKLSGSDMVPALCGFAAREGFSVFFFGGTPGTAERTAEIMVERNPGLRVAGHHCPDYGFEHDPTKLASALDAVRAAQPDLCFVALGSPKQEFWMDTHANELGPTIYMGVGATFDFISGRVRRAPRWIQKTGFEWLWRIAMEPRRLWRRYLVEDMVFFRIFGRELLARWRRAR